MESSALNFLFYLLLVTVPSLIVYLTARAVLQKFLDQQLQRQNLETRKQERETVLPLRLQAYERLSLFCERIAIPGLLLRVQQPNMSANDLRISLLLAIQREYEHNITQQVYVSQKLWEIIRAARDDAENMISIANEDLPTDAAANAYGHQLLEIVERRGSTGVDTALAAIKKEASIVLS